MRFDGTFLPDPTTKRLATFGLIGASLGGNGGVGGDAGYEGTYARQAGSGSQGGAGGAVALVASGAARAEITGVGVQSVGGGGGNGGDAYTADYADTTTGGDGGAGGPAGAASLQWLSGSVEAVQYGLAATADGGRGGGGGKAGYNFFTSEGGDGGGGGKGGPASVLFSSGAVTVNLAGYLSVPGAGIIVSANGGDGGSGGATTDGSIAARGGRGGTGGAAGAADATVLGTVTFVGSDDPKRLSGQGILVQANGGAGGNGANAKALVGQAGGGGFAGPGGSATLTLGNTANPGTIRTSGNFAHGALVQSIGGGGGNGGQAGFNAQGGAGAAGGDGGAVVINAPNGSVIATGNSSSALLAQSIGGGGGAGGDTNSIAVGFNVAIGGNGGLGGNGSTVRLNLAPGSTLAPGVFASTSRLGGSGILAQSIGGSGGSGGSATSVGSSIFAMTIGGDGGGGGTGGSVNVTNGALITTWGDHAAGVQAQSIGGGGGKGGSATTFNVGVVAAASVAIGGRGGGGGPAGDVSVTNTGQVATYGADATGVLIQSIGGGGGSGGAAAARAIAVSPDPEVPAISLAVALGGNGGTGNTAGTANLNNSGLITTAGDGAIAVIAQSIGGGGGAGGDSTASSYSNGPSKKEGVNISVAVAVGGAGAGAGDGGGVAVGNSGVIATAGQDAYGVFAQSVGGGGGSGGAGDASASAGSGNASFGGTLSVGGGGGAGGHGGTVSLTNTNGGSITTRGDGADGIFAQSVGGGGGAGGGGVAHAGGGSVSIAVGVGGKGGAGGDGNTATVTNSGNVITRGTDSIGMSVQSIGGGGGKGGKGGATAGGASPLSNATALFDLLAGGLGFGPKATVIGDDILAFGKFGEQVTATFNELNGIFSQPQADSASKGTAPKINMSVAVGGSGGAAGHGGAANATNTGPIATYGAQSDGIYAQSVGGGGGSGGAATSASAAADDTPVQTSVAVGGSGGGGGDGGPVTVVNGTNGTIRTEGVLAFGIFAQSVGGGGGEGSVAGAVSGSLKSLSVGIGGNGGKGGDGGTVSVTTGTASSVTTTGKHGIGIYAQSIGGGGGLVRSMTTDQTFDPSKIAINPQGRVADVQGVSLTLGGQNGASGKGGEVLVTTGGLVTTSGLDAHAILAQSIGGGGGMAVGGQVIVPLSGAGGAGGGNGDGGTVTLRLQPGTGIVTGGDGAYGILAQSIGGGGGAAGDFSDVFGYQTGTANTVKSNTGNGAAVTITAASTFINTTGKNAPAIFAQSIGGGGGLVNYSFNVGPRLLVQARGTAGGQGSGGAVTVSLAGTRVFAEGVGSAGIFAQSDGQSSSPIRIAIDTASEVRGGLPDPNPQNYQPVEDRDAAAIRLMGGTGNQIDNAGRILALGDPKTSFAILTGPTSSRTVVNNTGTITGNIFLGHNGGNLVENRAGGLIDAPATINLGGGALQNAGTLHAGGAGTVGTTTLTGDLVQSSTGKLVIDFAPGSATADALQVTGKASLDGSIVPVASDPAKLRSGSRQVNILTATGGVTQNGVRVALLPVVRYGLSTTDANTLALSYNVDFAASDALSAEGLSSSNRREIGRALNTILADDAPALAALANGLVTATTARDVAARLDLASGEVAASAQQTSFAAQQAFTSTILRHVVGQSRPTGGPGAPYAVAALDPIAGPPADSAGMRVWVGGIGGSEVLSGTNGQGSLHSQAAGAMLGLDKWFDADHMVGLSVGGGTISFNVSDRASDGHATSVNVAGYGLARFGAAYVSGAVTYGNYATDLRRTGLGSAANLAASGRGSFSNNVLGGRVEFGWRQQVGGVTLTPFAALEVDHLWQSSFTESTLGDPGASGLALRFSRTEQTSVPLTLGGRVGSTFALAGQRVLSLSAELGWVHEFNPQRSVNAAFVAAPKVPFRVLGVSASRDAAQVGLDAKFSLTQSVALLGSFTGRFSQVETAVGGFGGLQVTW